MIAFLEGKIEEKEKGYAILNVGGIGYQVEISTRTYETLPQRKDVVRLLIHHHMTDSDQRLFGFSSAGEKQLFEKLITVKGVGPRLGLMILSGMKAEMLASAIIQGDYQSLSTIPGIGKKTAERIILELKDKMDAAGVTPGVDSGKSAERREEAIAALEALGFRKAEAEKAVMTIIRDHEKAEVSEIIKKALAKFKG